MLCRFRCQTNRCRSKPYQSALLKTTQTPYSQKHIIIQLKDKTFNPYPPLTTFLWLACGEKVNSVVNKLMIAVILSCSPAIANCFTIPSICHFPQKLHATQQSIILQAPKRKTKEQQIYNSKYFKGGILALLIELVGEVPKHERRDNRVRHLNRQREIERQEDSRDLYTECSRTFSSRGRMAEPRSGPDRAIGAKP